LGGVFRHSRPETSQKAEKKEAKVNLNGIHNDQDSEKRSRSGM